MIKSLGLIISPSTNAEARANKLSPEKLREAAHHEIDKLLDEQVLTQSQADKSKQDITHVVYEQNHNDMVALRTFVAIGMSDPYDDYDIKWH